MRLGLYSKKRKMAFVSFFMTFALFIGLLSVPTVKTRASEDMVYRLLTKGGVKAGDEIVLVYPVTKNSGGESKEYMRTLYSTGRNGMVDIVNGERIGGTDPLFKLTDKNPQINQVWTVEERDGVFALKNVNHENQTKYLDLTVAGSTRAMTAGEFKGLKIEQVSGKVGRFHVKSDSFALVYDIRGVDRGHFKALAATSLPAESEILIYKKSPRVVEESTEPSVPGEGEPTIPGNEEPVIPPTNQEEGFVTILPSDGGETGEPVLRDLYVDEAGTLKRETMEFVLNTQGEFKEGEELLIAFQETTGKERTRILFSWDVGHSKYSGKTDIVGGNERKIHGNITTRDGGFGEKNQVWKLESLGSGNFALKSHYYLNLDRTPENQPNITATDSPSEIKIKKTEVEGQYFIKSGKNYLGYDGDKFRAVKTEERAVAVHIFKKAPYIVNYQFPSERDTELSGLPIADDGRPSGKTVGQPFISMETAKNKHFRIPAMVTLDNGRIVTAADARWEQAGDACGIDIVVSYSDDNGKNWTYHTPIHFNDAVNGGNFSYMSKAATIMDAALTKGKNGELYLLADIFSNGVALNTVSGKPANASGYRTMEDGKKRLVLYLDADPSRQTDENWDFYVGDFEGDQETSFAPVYFKGDASLTPKYYIDGGYYLYDKNKEPLYVRQLGNSDKKVKQNVFYTNADLHVRCATYLALYTSKDNGETWSKPLILNPQILNDVLTQRFLGVGPGSGITLEDGTIMIPVYEHPTERSSFIYSKDGVNWKRTANAPGSDWSSESVLVEISKDKVRQFVRHEGWVLKYLDYEKNGEEWEPKAYGTLNDVRVDSTCQLSAIRLSKTVDQKPVVLVSAPVTYKRRNGKIFTLVLNEDGSMKKVSEYRVTTTDAGNKYAYSCLTEQKDGKIGLLVEDGSEFEKITYMNFDLETLAPNVKFDETTPQTEPGQSGSQNGSEGSEQTPGQSGSQNGSEGSEQTPGQSGSQNGSEGSEQTPGQSGSQSGSEGSEQTPGQSGSQNGSEGSEQTPGQSGIQNGSEGSEQTPGQSGSQNGSEGSEQTPNQNGNQGVSPAPQENQNNYVPYIPYFPIEPVITLEEADKKTTIAEDVKEKKSEEKSEEKELSEIKVEEDKTPQGSANLSSSKDKIAMIRETKEYRNLTKDNPKRLVAVAKTLDEAEEAKTSFVSKSGEVLRDTFIQLGKNHFYLDSKGELAENRLIVTYQEDSNKVKTYYAGKNGVLVKNGFVTLKKGTKAYFDKNGEMVKNKVITVKGKKYFFSKDGKMVTGKVITIKGKLYQITKSGVMKKKK